MKLYHDTNFCIGFYLIDPELIICGNFYAIFFKQFQEFLLQILNKII